MVLALFAVLVRNALVVEVPAVLLGGRAQGSEEASAVARDGLSATTRTYRVEAEGIVDGQVRARITAIVQKRADDGSEAVAVLEWSGIR